MPQNKSEGRDQADLVYVVLQEYNSEDTIKAVLVDNTAVNTGKDNGLVACPERKLKRRLHLIGCLLHFNKLPLRHIITHLDGSPNGANKFSGPIGKAISKEVRVLPCVHFSPVETSLHLLSMIYQQTRGYCWNTCWGSLLGL